MLECWNTGKRTTVIINVIGLLVTSGFAAEVRFDFESGDLQGWKVVEGSFVRTVTDRASYHNGGPYATRQGKFHLSTVEGIQDRSTDAQMGVIESPVFVLEAPEISFLQSGGNHADTYIALCTLDGKEHVQSRGKNSEVMTRIQWSLPNLLGQKVFFRIVDGHSSGWGVVTCDDFIAQGAIDLQSTAEQFAKRKRVLPKMAEENSASPDSLRAAIQDLTATFGNRYPNGKTYLARLDEICKNDRDGRSKELMALQRESMVANPLVSDQPLLYSWRNQYKLGGFHAIDTLFHTCEANTH